MARTNQVEKIPSLRVSLNYFANAHYVLNATPFGARYFDFYRFSVFLQE